MFLLRANGLYLLIECASNFIDHNSCKYETPMVISQHVGCGFIGSTVVTVRDVCVHLSTSWSLLKASHVGLPIHMCPEVGSTSTHTQRLIGPASLLPPEASFTDT